MVNDEILAYDTRTKACQYESGDHLLESTAELDSHVVLVKEIYDKNDKWSKLSAEDKAKIVARDLNIKEEATKAREAGVSRLSQETLDSRGETPRRSPSQLSESPEDLFVYGYANGGGSSSSDDKGTLPQLIKIMQKDNETSAKRVDVDIAREERLKSEGASSAETALLREKSIAEERTKKSELEMAKAQSEICLAAKRAASEAKLAEEATERKKTAVEADAYRTIIMADAEAKALVIREQAAADGRKAQNEINLKRAEAEQKTAEANAATARMQMEMMQIFMAQLQNQSK